MKAQFLKIEWNDKKTQSTAKKNGFIWNANLKLWEHKSKTAIEIPEHYSIAKFAVSENNKIETKKETTNNLGVGCYTTYEKAMKYGYDAIEN